MNRKTVLIFSLVLIVLVAGGYAAAQIAQANYQFQGSLFEPAPQAYEFTLNDYTGQPFSLSEQRGKVVLLFFGYTNCPDVCPATLSDYKRIHAQLEEEGLADQVEFVFISVDPKRDTAEVVRNYVTAFHPTFIGLVADDTEELQPVMEGYFVFAEEEAPEHAGEDGGEHPQNEYEEYLVAHTSRIYVVDKQGRLRLTFPFGLSVDAITQDVRHLVNEGS